MRGEARSVRRWRTFLQQGLWRGRGVLSVKAHKSGGGWGGPALCNVVLVFVRSEWVTVQSGGGLVGGDVGGAAAVAGGGLGPLDVEVEQLHLSGRWEEETAAGLEEESSALLARPPSGTCHICLKATFLSCPRLSLSAANSSFPL